MVWWLARSAHDREVLVSNPTAAEKNLLLELADLKLVQRWRSQKKLKNGTRINSLSSQDHHRVKYAKPS